MTLEGSEVSLCIPNPEPRVSASVTFLGGVESD